MTKTFCTCDQERLKFLMQKFGIHIFYRRKGEDFHLPFFSVSSSFFKMFLNYLIVLGGIFTLVPYLLRSHKWISNAIHSVITANCFDKDLLFNSNSIILELLIGS